MNREEANQLKVTQLNDRMFRNHLEDCLAFGKPLLIENIEEELDPLLDPVLERRIVRKVRTGPALCLWPTEQAFDVTAVLVFLFLPALGKRCSVAVVIAVVIIQLVQVLQHAWWTHMSTGFALCQLLAGMATCVCVYVLRL